MAPLFLKSLTCVTVSVPGPVQAATLALPDVSTPVSDHVALIVWFPPGTVTTKLKLACRYLRNNRHSCCRVMRA